MNLRRILVLLVVAGCVGGLTGSSATAAGEEIVVETQPLIPGQPFLWIDPAVAYTTQGWLTGYATCLRLLNNDEVTGALVPDGAAMPTISNGRKTYTFTIANHAFSGSPPGEAVTAASFKRAIERATSPTMALTPGGTPARGFVRDIVGAQEFFDGDGITPSGISGVAAVGNTLTIELLAPAENFLHRIAANFFCATPSGAPSGFVAPPTPPLASAGPYFVSSASASEVVLERNPNYGGTRLRNLGTIRVVPHGSPLAEDYVADAPATYTPQPGALDLVNLTTGVQTLALNTSRPPFDNLDMRKAAAYVINRTALSALRGWEPTDQFLSPLMPGHQAASIYPLDGSGTATAVSFLNGATPSVRLCHTTNPPDAAMAALAETQLEIDGPGGVGFDVTTVGYPVGQYFTTILPNPANCELARFGWIPDFLDPSNVLVSLFGSTSYPVEPLPASGFNVSFFSDPTPGGFNDRFAAAAVETPESARLGTYGQLDVDLAEDAVPSVAIGYIKRRDVFSDRIGCRILSQALFGYAINRLCIEVAETAPPGGTVSTGEESSTAAPLQTEVTVPSGGDVTITQGQSTPSASPEYTLLEQQLDISAPTQTAADPLVFTFELDAATLAAAGLTADEVAIYRNGVPIADCTGAGATPDPCVASRTTQPDGDGEIVVRSSSASSWGFGERYDTSGGFLQPVDNPPTLNTVNGGGTVPVKFRLGGNEGLAILAAGSPTSVQVACPGSTAVDAIEETTSSSGGGLSYDPVADAYQYNWKTSKSWAGTCRRLTLTFREGSQLQALFKLK